MKTMSSLQKLETPGGDLVFQAQGEGHDGHEVPGMRKIGAEIQDKLNFTNKISRLKCYDTGVCLDLVIYSNILKSRR